jgi:uncharacterized protein DUF6229
MSKSLGAEQVAQWRNSAERDNPAGPLFATGEFAEAEITNGCGQCTRYATDCSDSCRLPCP